MSAKLSDSGPDWDRYQQASSGGRSKPMRRVSRADFVDALRKLHAINQEIADGLMTAYPDASTRVMVEDWRTSDSPEAAAERATFEKEQGQ